MASDGMKATKQLRKKIKKNEKKLSKELAAISTDKMGAILKRLQASVGSLRRQAELPPEEAVVEATSRRKRKAQREVSFKIDRSPEPNQEILLQRRILTTIDITDESAESSVESDGGMSLSSEVKNDEGDLNLCLQQPEKASTGGRGEDSWWLHPEDLEVPKLRARRYFHTERHQCELCGIRGHLGDKCPLGGPICVLCGKLGHRKHACRSVVCHACLGTGHDVRACPLAAKRRDSKCLRCGTMGHIEQDCFEKWRQFHVTITPGSTAPVKGKQRRNRLASCSNCGKRGHFSEECFHPHPRYRHLFSPGSSFVSSYDEQPTFASLPETPKASKAKEQKKMTETRTKRRKKKKTEEAETSLMQADKCDCGQEPKEEGKRPLPTCETLRVRPGSDLGEFVPLDQGPKRRYPLDEAEATKRGKKKKRKKKTAEEDKSFESPDGASFCASVGRNLVKMKGMPPKSSRRTGPSAKNETKLKFSQKSTRRMKRYWK